MSTHCGTVAVIGEPNAGKSTLVNRLVGGKVSIVSPKVQTTRSNVRGICIHKQTQLVLVDTPGIFSTDKPFEKSLVKEAWNSLSGADAVLLLVDARKKLSEETLDLIRQLKRREQTSVSLALNKIDKVKKAALLELVQACSEHGVFDRIFMISALTGDGVDDVKAYLAEQMPQADWLYPKDDLSDQPMHKLAAEITREKVFLLLSEELPYSIHVEPEQWDEDKQVARIAQAIYVQKESQKKIVLGEKGAMIKRIGTSARRDIETLTGKRVHLQLFVKVKADWKEKL